MPSISIDSHGLAYDYYPDICPICHHAVSPGFLVSSISGQPHKDGTRISMAFKCTYRNCMHMFIGIYERIEVDAVGNSIGEFKFNKAVPLEFEEPEIHEEVIEISPSFKTINGQSHAAEAYGLDEIAGVGYRKALEFLIKDFCIHKNPEKEDEIKKMFLGAVIDDYVDDTNIKTCAKRAAWLGNDETHYVKKWEEKDIQDLKLLIELTSGWVRNNLLTKKYMSEME